MNLNTEIKNLEDRINRLMDEVNKAETAAGVARHNLEESEKKLADFKIKAKKIKENKR